MHTAGNGLARGSHDVQVHRVLIDLGQQGRRRNGEYKGLGRLAGTWNRFGPFTHGYQFWLTPQSMHLLAHLSIGGKFHWLALLLQQTHRHLLHFGMLPDRGHGQTGRQQIQPPDALLEGGMHGRRAAVAAIRHTGNGAKQLRPLDEARKR